ncbi:helix-turn-helix domain-containing protein [Lactiplantibacillus carotarum]|uniref:helix-turn-helix domain-containing protein n=1 Tax=Lactiplantibacillus carotarum TaxID=2993456 RepID=UPI00298ED884|nr:helix-turn-helix domain-containing protein [Lactiplantibacillus carotarum]
MIQSQLKTILADRTISNEEFATMTGINPHTLTKLISGHAQSISFAHLNAITRALDVELGELFVITPDLDLELSLDSIDETTKNFRGTLHFIDNDQHLVTDLQLTGCYHQSGPLFTFTINDAYDDDLKADGIATRLTQLQPTPCMTPTKQHLLNLLAAYPEQQAWFEPEGMPLSANPTETEMERYLQVGNLIARTQYEKLHRVLEPLVMSFLAALYHDFPNFLGNPQVIAVPWGSRTPSTFLISFWRKVRNR